MKLTKWLLPPLLIASLSGAASPVLPEEFRGRWNSACNLGDDVDFIDMSDKVFGYWEEICDVKAITASSSTEISVQLHCRQNDGAEFDTSTTYKIVNGKLTVASANAPSISRVRCVE